MIDLSYISKNLENFANCTITLLFNPRQALSLKNGKVKCSSISGFSYWMLIAIISSIFQALIIVGKHLSVDITVTIFILFFYSFFQLLGVIISNYIALLILSKKPYIHLLLVIQVHLFIVGLMTLLFNISIIPTMFDERIANVILKKNNEQAISFYKENQFILFLIIIIALTMLVYYYTLLKSILLGFRGRIILLMILSGIFYSVLKVIFLTKMYNNFLLIIPYINN